MTNFDNNIRVDFRGHKVEVGDVVVVSGGKTQYQGFRMMEIHHFTQQGFSCVPVTPKDRYDGVPKFYPTSAVAVLGRV